MTTLERPAPEAPAVDPQEVAREATPREATPREATGDALRAERTPRVTVGMPVYNGEEYLERALESLLAQDFEDFELIISDNASTDGTEAIARRYAERDPRVRYHRAEANQGAAWNFSHLVDMARGEYFRWACHDDMVEPSHLGRCVAALDEASPSVVLAYTRSVLIDEHDVGQWTQEDNLDTRGMPPHARLRQLAQNLRYSNILYGLTRTEAMRQTRRIEPYESSDYVLLAELALLGEFVEVPAYLFRRRIHARMSRQANRSRLSIAQWFSTSNRSGLRLPQLRLMWGYTSAVMRIPMSPIERVRSAFALRHWARRSAKPFLRELVALVSPPYVYR